MVGCACLALVACSSDAGEDRRGGAEGSTAPPVGSTAAGVGEGSSDGAGGGTVAGGVAGSPASFAEYYRKLGVAEPVVTCYVGALTELGVVSLDQLEVDQELGARAADRFDRCVADVGGAAATTPTT